MHPGLPHDWDAANGPGVELGDEGRAALRRDLADNHGQLMPELIWRSDGELVKLHASLHVETATRAELIREYRAMHYVFIKDDELAIERRTAVKAELDTRFPGWEKLPHVNRPGGLNETEMRLVDAYRRQRDREERHARLAVRRADEAARDAREREITERAARNRRGYPR
jgi:hypothetical protein